MTRDRLAQILKERDTDPASYQKDGWKYFEEFLPVIEGAISVVEVWKDPAVDVLPEPNAFSDQSNVTPEKVSETPKTVYFVAEKGPTFQEAVEADEPLMNTGKVKKKRGRKKAGH